MAPNTAITEQLERVLASDTFEKAQRLSEFLRFLVRESVEGRAGLLKEYTIALEVFERPSSFDPRVDSVVRVAARSLRVKLRDYYDTQGRADPILIDLPKGGYAPVFHHRVPAGSGASPPYVSTSTVITRRRVLVTAAIVLACTALVAVLVRFSGGTRQAEFVIAVLPFDSMSQAPDDAVFSEGLVDELTIRLANLEGVRVMARTSSRLLKAARDPLAEARKYRVDALVEGSVTRAGGVVRISAKLVGSANGYQLWSERYDRVARDSFLVQDEIALNISRALQSRVSPPTVATSRAPLNPEAIRLYWTGRYMRRQVRPDAMPRSAELFEESVKVDPKYADAWAALADTNAMLAYHQTSGSAPEDFIRRAKFASARALELDGKSAEALVAQATVELYFDRNWDAADRTFQRALRLNPSYYKTRQRYATALISRGRFDEAIQHARTAIELDPLSVGISNDLGVILYIGGRCDESIELARQALTADPSFSPAHALLGCCYSSRGRWTESIPEFQRAISMSERFSYLIGHLGHDYARSGNHAEANALLRELTDSPDQSAVSYAHVAYILSGLREHDRAIDALEKAVKRYDADVAYMGVDPALDELRAQPRFIHLLETIGLPNLRTAK
ncbi:MAG TPA: tetratricopeptide repeat protein [Vicinamibacterales bacterium]